jgi:ribosomal protein S18 acetylase RimI-like enzyme
MSSVYVDVGASPAEEILLALQRLIPQLSASAPRSRLEELQEIISSECTTLLVARNDGPRGPIVGMLTLVMFRIPTGQRTWIEDVVVDGSCRRMGVASALVRHAIDLAKARGSRSIDLTARVERTAAHQLYTALGFKMRATSVYRFEP